MTVEQTVRRTEDLEILKIVITGAYAAGKTQFIKTISEVDALSTEEEVSDTEERQLKSQTTVALDFGKITVNSNVSLFLFGTPGQERFDFMWDILSYGCIGYVVLVDSTRPAHLRESVNIIHYFSQILEVPFVVGCTKQDDPASLPVDYIRYRLELPPEVPVLPCVATDRESVKEVLLALLTCIRDTE